MNSFTFKQLGTNNKISIQAADIFEANQQAAQKLNCRETSCILLNLQGTVTRFTVANLQINETIKLKSNTRQSACEEIASATNTKIDDWEVLSEEKVFDADIIDIEYGTDTNSR